MLIFSFVGRFMGPKSKKSVTSKKRARKTLSSSSEEQSTTSEDESSNVPIADSKLIQKKPTVPLKISKARAKARETAITTVSTHSPISVARTSSPRPQRPVTEFAVPQWAFVIQKDTFHTLGATWQERLLQDDWVLKCTLCSTPTKACIIRSKDACNWKTHAMRHTGMSSSQSVVEPASQPCNTCNCTQGRDAQLWADITIRWGLSFVQGAGIMNDVRSGTGSRKTLQRDVVAELSRRDAWLKT